MRNLATVSCVFCFVPASLAAPPRFRFTSGQGDSNNIMHFPKGNAVSDLPTLATITTTLFATVPATPPSVGQASTPATDMVPTATIATILAPPTSLSLNATFGNHKGGRLILTNACPHEIYANEVSCWGVSHIILIPANTSISTPLWNPVCSGISVKLRNEPSLTAEVPITQVEYTWDWVDHSKNKLYYDLSDINCGPTSLTSRDDCPFMSRGMWLGSTDKKCATEHCEPGLQHCEGIYEHPDDDFATQGCDIDQHNLLFVACAPHNVTLPNFANEETY